MMLNLLKYFLFINLGLVFWIFYLMAFPVTVDVIHNEPFTVYPEVVKRGEMISWEVEFTKTNPYPATLNRSIVCDDDTLIPLTSQITNFPQGDRQIAKGDVIIPEKTSAGVCHIELQATYHINPVRNIEKGYTTKDFLVIR